MHPHLHEPIAVQPRTVRDHVLDDTRAVVALRYRVRATRAVDRRVDGAITARLWVPRHLAGPREGRSDVAAEVVMRGAALQPAPPASTMRTSQTIVLKFNHSPPMRACPVDGQPGCEVRSEVVTVVKCTN